MAAQRARDHRAGPVPEIRADGDSIVFYMHVAGIHQQPRLIIRCDGDGSVWASIASERPSEAPGQEISLR